MYAPDSYLFESNLALLATLSDEELADPTLIAQITPSTATLVVLGQALAGVIWEGLQMLGAAFAPAGDPDEPGSAFWLYLPYY